MLITEMIRQVILCYQDGEHVTLHRTESPLRSHQKLFSHPPSTALHVLFIRSDVLPRVSFRGLVSFRSTFSNSTPLPRASHCLLVSSQQIEDHF